MGVGDIFKKAGKNIESAAVEATEELSDSVDPLKAFLRDTTDVPSLMDLGEDFNFRTAATKFLEATVAIYESQTTEAIKSLKEVGKEAAEAGTVVLKKMAEISNLVAKGRISPESGQVALSHYVETLKLIGHRLQNKAKVEAYKRAQAAISTARGVLFSAVQVALQMGQPAAASFLTRISPPTA